VLDAFLSSKPSRWEGAGAVPEENVAWLKIIKRMDEEKGVSDCPDGDRLLRRHCFRRETG